MAITLDDVMSLISRPLGAGAKQPAASPSISADDIISAAGRPLGSAGNVAQIIDGAARKHGVPPELLHRIAGSESSYKPTAANSRSSAKGLFQFIDSTWAGMGGKPGEQLIPEKNADLGAKYVRQNIDTLTSGLGRSPSYGEVYAAHYFGPGVTKMLNGARPDMPIERGLSMFNDSNQVRAIMRQNPNLRGKSVGQVLESLHQKAGYQKVGQDKRADAADVIETDQVAMADPYADSWEADSYGPDETRDQNNLA